MYLRKKANIININNILYYYIFIINKEGSEYINVFLDY